MRSMPKRSGKVTPLAGHKDANQLARTVMARLEAIAEEHPGKNPAAVALGRKGGLKGGKARMAGMTAEQRRRLAEKGAKARWGKKT
jgi:hypothetical protein